MAAVNKPILLDETGKDMAAAIREQNEILSRATITMNPADYIVDCEYNEGEVEITKTNEAGETVTETITAVTSWYERYASGKVRQGGVVPQVWEDTSSVPTMQILLNVPMANEFYYASVSGGGNDGEMQYMELYFGKTPTSFQGVYVEFFGTRITPYIVWKVEGMGAKL